MWWSKEAQPKPKKMKKIKEVVYGDPQYFDLKCIDVHLVMADGSKFVTKVYGSFYQYISVCGQLSAVGPQTIFTALQRAQGVISNMEGSKTYVDDPRNTNSSITGQVVTATILVSSEVSFIEKYMVASIVEREVEVEN
jgi:hypothetical protein